MKSVPVAEAIKIALGHERNGHYQQVESIYRQLLHAFPDETAFHEKLMSALFRQGRIDEAYAAFGDFLATQRADDGADDADTASMYLKSLRATASPPSPLRRRARFQSLVRLLMETDGVGGAIAECGCFKGLSSHLMCSTLRKRDADYRGADYHIFDSFQGLSAPTLEDDVPEDFASPKDIKSMCVEGAFAASLAEVRRNLAEFPAIEFHAGWIPLTFQGLPERSYRFVHVDVDLYNPTIDSFEYFHPRLAPGGMIVSDDYGWPGARQALEDFCGQQGLKLSLTPHDQAFVRRAG